MLSRKITLGILVAGSVLLLLLVSRALYLRLSSRDPRAIRVEADLMVIRTQLAFYKAANGAYPSTDQGLVALVVKPTSLPSPSRWTQLFYAVPKDPWGKEYFYLCPGRTNPTDYDLFSAGPDGKAYTADDDWGK
jgi:general secretion pathway protein G